MRVVFHSRPLFLNFAKNIPNLSAVKLKELGTFETQKTDDFPYECGQFFLHRVFAYRGVILNSYQVKVFDKPKAQKSTAEKIIEGRNLNSGREIQPSIVSYYTVLINKSDWNHMRVHRDITTYLSEQTIRGVTGEKELVVINGMDYASHDDVLPYTSCTDEPIEHDLFPQFFEPNKSQDNVENVRFCARNVLHKWIANNVSWLTPIEVHRETTEGIRITVMSFYLGSFLRSRHTVTEHLWRYTIRIENFNDTTVTLRERLWKVFSQNGKLELHHGSGVVGFTPQMSPNQPAFQYSSHIQLECAHGGHMWGHFKMERENGALFDVNIPPFVLDGSKRQLSKI